MGAAYERVVEALAGHGFKIQHHGTDRARAQCPGHGGDDKNLALAVGDQGVLLKCMSYDCPPEDVAGAIGLTLTDLFDNQREAVYDYGGGHRVTRRRTRDGKKILQQNKPAVTALYRHPLSEPIETSPLVVLVEGEKCVDAALRLGERCVTTWPQGADGVGQVDLAPLGGKTIRIIADNDEPGLRAASRLISRLGGLATVEGVWIVPEPKKSVDDLWLEGRTLEELVPVVVQPIAEEVPKRALELLTLSTVESKRTRFLWEGKVPQSAVTIAAGRGGTGKSTFAIWLAGQLNCGTLPGELAGQPVDVLYVSHEDAVDEVVAPRADANGVIRERFHLLGIRSRDLGGVVVPNLPDDMPYIRQAIEQTGAKLLIIDPITSTLAGGDNDRMADVRRVMDPLNAMAAELGVSVIGIAHFRKGGGNQSDLISGSHAWRDAARCVLLFARDEEEGTTVVTLDKINSGEAGKSYKYRLDIISQITDEGTFTDVGHVVWEGDSTTSVGDLINNEQERSKQGGLANEILEHVRSFEGRAVKTEDIVKLFAVGGVKPNTVRQTLVRLTGRGTLTKPEYGWFAIPATDPRARVGGSHMSHMSPSDSGVTGVTGVTPSPARVREGTCRICGFPLPDVVVAAGDTAHPSCDR